MWFCKYLERVWGYRESWQQNICCWQPSERVWDDEEYKMGKINGCIVQFGDKNLANDEWSRKPKDGGWLWKTRKWNVMGFVLNISWTVLLKLSVVKDYFPLCITEEYLCKGWISGKIITYLDVAALSISINIHKHLFQFLYYFFVDQ